MNTPILVEVHRGSQIESYHRGSVAVADAAGDTVLAIGDTARAIYPRSALKLFQAIPLIESGAARHFNLSAQEIALACSSHNAEDVHTHAVADWLQRLGLDADALACGADCPMSHTVSHALTAAGKQPTRLHHNCSGKHAGMLTLAQFLNADPQHYYAHDHPTQRAWMTVLSALINVDVAKLDWERDGCGLPAVCMPLTKLAHAFACFAGDDGDENGAMQTIIAAIRAHPQLLAGSGRCCTDVVRESGGTVIIKTGAEGVYAGVIPNRNIGFALKIDDGATRAATVALGAVLTVLGEGALVQALPDHFAPVISNSQGVATGKIVATPLPRG